MRRVGLMRPHGSSLVDGIGIVFSSGFTAGTGSGSRAGTWRGSRADTSRGRIASNGIGNEPVRPVQRMGPSYRQTTSRARNDITATPSLNLGSSFHFDTLSGFFQGLGGNNVIGSLRFQHNESSGMGGNNGMFAHVIAQAMCSSSWSSCSC